MTVAAMRDAVMKPGGVRHYRSPQIHAEIRCRGAGFYSVRVRSFVKSTRGRVVYTADFGTYHHSVMAVKMFLTVGPVTVWYQAPMVVAS